MFSCMKNYRKYPYFYNPNNYSPNYSNECPPNNLGFEFHPNNQFNEEVRFEKDINMNNYNIRAFSPTRFAPNFDPNMANINELNHKQRMMDNYMPNSCVGRSFSPHFNNFHSSTDRGPKHNLVFTPHFNDFHSPTDRSPGQDRNFPPHFNDFHNPSDRCPNHSQTRMNPCMNSDHLEKAPPHVIHKNRPPTPPNRPHTPPNCPHTPLNRPHTPPNRHPNFLDKPNNFPPCNLNKNGSKSRKFRRSVRRKPLHRSSLRNLFLNPKTHYDSLTHYFNVPQNISNLNNQKNVSCLFSGNKGQFGGHARNRVNEEPPTGGQNGRTRTMGQTLSEPVTQKETSRCEDSKLRVGASCMQGWRVNMEDAHTTILSLPDDPRTAFFAVYDGHGGARIAQYAGKHLHKVIIKRPEYNGGDVEAAIKQGYLDIDYNMQHDDILKDEVAGTTAICCFLRDNKLYCGNVGDSRAVGSLSGLAIELSNDHKPSLASEQRRITAAGGWVEMNRVNGNLALSRALGDFVFKKNDQKGPEEQIVTAWPDVSIHEINEDWEFVILACDGIWDVMTSQEVVDFIRFRLGEGMEPEEICEELMTCCLAPDCQMGGLGCDNMTVVLVVLTHYGSWRQLQEKCSRPCPHMNCDVLDDSDSELM